ncbi:MAG: hypothetical protein Q9167_001997 [Letrouitia subvulpina]
MFIIDEIYHRPPRLPDINVMGGGGLYAALGARLFRPPPSSSNVGWVIHKGYDFPNEMETVIKSWETDCCFIGTPNRNTTRAVNVYEANERRAFSYINEKIRVDEFSLTPQQLKAKTFHMICSPQRCIDLVKGILRQQGRDPTVVELSKAPHKKQSFVWEPVPDLCVPDEFEKCVEALNWVDVMSPNLEEFATLVNDSFDLDDASGLKKLRLRCDTLLNRNAGQNCKAIVVRLGERGCLVAQPNQEKHLPVYYEPGLSPEKVVDPTGCGNAFLGGLCIGLLENSFSVEDAAVYATIAASFVIEQVGIPALTHAGDGNDELWNGESVKARLRSYQERIAFRECN